LFGTSRFKCSKSDDIDIGDGQAANVEDDDNDDDDVDDSGYLHNDMQTHHDLVINGN